MLLNNFNFKSQSIHFKQIAFSILRLHLPVSTGFFHVETRCFAGPAVSSYLVEAGEEHEQCLPYPVLQPVLLRVHVVPGPALGHQVILGRERSGSELPPASVTHENKANDNCKSESFRRSTGAYHPPKGREEGKKDMFL